MDRDGGKRTEKQGKEPAASHDVRRAAVVNESDVRKPVANGGDDDKAASQLHTLPPRCD